MDIIEGQPVDSTSVVVARSAAACFDVPCSPAPMLCSQHPTYEAKIMYIHIYIYIHIRVRVRICVYVCVCVCVCVCTYTYIYTYTQRSRFQGSGSQSTRQTRDIWRKKTDVDNSASNLSQCSIGLKRGVVTVRDGSMHGVRGANYDGAAGALTRRVIA